MQHLVDRAGLTHRQLSQAVGVTERAVSAWVHGRSIPRLDRAILLASTLQVSLREICVEMGLSVEGLIDD